MNKQDIMDALDNEELDVYDLLSVVRTIAEKSMNKTYCCIDFDQVNNNRIEFTMAMLYHVLRDYDY